MITNCQACRLGTLTVSCPIMDKEGQPCYICNGAGARLHRHTIVQLEGPVPNDILLLGEAPGVHEDLEGLPFRAHAPAGRVLHRALNELGMYPAIDNVVHCHPPQNKLRDYPDCVVTCRDKWLPDILAQVQPKVIVVLGALAGATWFPGMKATELSQMARACVWNEWRGIVVGSFHPSYVARGTDPRAWPALLASLRRARDLAKEA